MRVGTTAPDLGKGGGCNGDVTTKTFHAASQVATRVATRSRALPFSERSRHTNRVRNAPPLALSPSASELGFRKTHSQEKLI